MAVTAPGYLQTELSIHWFKPPEWFRYVREGLYRGHHEPSAVHMIPRRPGCYLIGFARVGEQPGYLETVRRVWFLYDWGKDGFGPFGGALVDPLQVAVGQVSQPPTWPEVDTERIERIAAGHREAWRAYGVRSGTPKLAKYNYDQLVTQ